jgi:N-carbamoyl-L-amino-acid hydrolase
MGSRLLSGLLDPAVAAEYRDREGVSLDQARSAAGFEGALSSVRLAPGYYSAFVEMHIEQGPILERHNVPLGIVTSIAAPAGLRIAIDGEGGHAGTVLMFERHDAFLAAAEIALAVEASARASGSPDTVGTVGVCDVFPGAVNSVPSRVRMEVDVRDTDEARRDEVLAKIKRACVETRLSALRTSSTRSFRPAIRTDCGSSGWSAGLITIRSLCHGSRRRRCCSFHAGEA